MSDSQNAGSTFGLGNYGGNASIFGANQLPDVLGLVQSKLQQAAASPDLFAQVFGDKANMAEIQTVRSQWSVGDFSQLPSVQILSAANTNGAFGAYASSTQTMYLSDSLFQSNAAPTNAVLGAVGVLVEETFHWLDDRVGADTQGDEGELAKDLLFGVSLSDSELSRIKSEDDHGFINVGGQKLLVEQASIVGNNLANTLIGTNMADVIYGYQGSDTLYGNGGNDLLNGYGFTDNERDTLVGGTGADRFVLGDASTVFYSKNGSSDFAVITDFNLAESDTISLKKLAFNNTSGNRAYGYRLMTVGVNTEIRVDNTNELVATLQNRTGVSLLRGFSFEGTPKKAENDFNGDGNSDVLWRNQNGKVHLWLMNGTQVSGRVDLESPGLDWQIQATGDFNRDGQSDILWRHQSGKVHAWLMNGTQVSGRVDLESPGLDWQIQGKRGSISPSPSGLMATSSYLTQLANGQLIGKYKDVDGWYGAQCWDLVAYATGINSSSKYWSTTNWKAGANVMSNGNVAVGTAIATFAGPNGKYDGGAYLHTAIFAGYDTVKGVSGFWVWDQNFDALSNGDRSIKKHFIRNNSSKSSDADNYFVINV